MGAERVGPLHALRRREADRVAPLVLGIADAVREAVSNGPEPAAGVGRIDAGARPRRHAQAPAGAQEQVGEVLADAAALPEDLGDRRGDRGRSGREREVLVQAVRQIDEAVDDGPARREFEALAAA